jgi:hypothetical protein
LERCKEIGIVGTMMWKTHGDIGWKRKVGIEGRMGRKGSSVGGQMKKKENIKLFGCGRRERGMDASKQGHERLVIRIEGSLEI